MNDSSKLVLLLNSLDPGELQEMYLWLKSPLHNNSPRLIALFRFLRKNVWRKDTPFPLLKALRVLKIVSQNAKTEEITTKDKQDYRKIASRLTLQLEEFLKWKQYKRNETGGALLLMNSFLERQLYKANSKLINKTKRLQQQNQLRDLKFYKNEFELAEMGFFMDMILRNRKAGDSMMSVINTLHHSCFIQLLRYYCALTNFKNLLTLESEVPFQKVLLDYLENSDDLKDNTVNLYYRLLKLLNNGKTEDYFSFKDLLFSSLQEFDKNELRQFFAFMSNYCQKMTNEGNSEFFEERFTIFKTGLDLGCWTTSIYFSHHQFVQIIYVSLQLNKLDWTEQFISNYKDKLPPHVAENTLLFCQSRLAFSQGKYDQAQDYLRKINHLEDFYWKLEVKTLLLRIYYDNGDLSFENFDIHPIHNELEALRVNALRGSGTKMAEQSRIKFSNFSLILKKILIIKRNRIFKKIKQEEIEKLETEFLNTKPIIGWHWLVEKIDELKTTNLN